MMDPINRAGSDTDGPKSHCAHNRRKCLLTRQIPHRCGNTPGLGASGRAPIGWRRSSALLRACHVPVSIAFRIHAHLSDSSPRGAGRRLPAPGDRPHRDLPVLGVGGIYSSVWRSPSCSAAGDWRCLGRPSAASVVRVACFARALSQSEAMSVSRRPHAGSCERGWFRCLATLVRAYVFFVPWV
jgi:hypothetical protein